MRSGFVSGPRARHLSGAVGMLSAGWQLGSRPVGPCHRRTRRGIAALKADLAAEEGAAAEPDVSSCPPHPGRGSTITRSLSGVQLVASGARAGLVDAIDAVLPGAS